MIEIVEIVRDTRETIIDDPVRVMTGAYFGIAFSVSTVLTFEALICKF